jgi:hypothetical protein
MPTPSSLRLAADVSPGGWVARSIGPFGSGVGGIVPLGFQTYARILHPAVGPDGTAVRWSAVAEWSGRAIHPRVQFDPIAKPRAPALAGRRPFAEPPRIGNLPPTHLAALLEILGHHTGAAYRCWFCLWDGYGWVQGSPAGYWMTAASGLRWLRRVGRDPGRIPPAFGPEGRKSPRLRLPEREYLLFGGPLAAAAEMGWRPSDGSFDPQSPNLFWPDDQAWCVATEIDLDSTYLGGSAALVADLLADARLESLPVEPTDSTWATSDDINA